MMVWKLCKVSKDFKASWLDEIVFYLCNDRSRRWIIKFIKFTPKFWGWTKVEVQITSSWLSLQKMQQKDQLSCFDRSIISIIRKKLKFNLKNVFKSHLADIVIHEETATLKVCYVFHFKTLKIFNCMLRRLFIIE